MRYIKREDDVIEVYRNKRKPIRKIKPGYKNEDGCIACCLFEVCLLWGGGDSSTCNKMEEARVIEPKDREDRFFIDVPLKDENKDN